ncbi:hypothetical protein Afil01_05190 [Actinorhabdospora filicis]|uniref:Gram-positive cocci surface proteins LPxTG domain-containing protein n=1 Tax=Actinorhabdospora filicis TaxID=1785913 RepID=A0A9W6W1B4_9ACTN|nr:LPXTG cell wall anchor domain-containing protein [Actinorhabdospora filicis]GLZ75712.1 hypothetical protein Afil01_05190 [Actinorhabdospora filicis]
MKDTRPLARLIAPLAAALALVAGVLFVFGTEPAQAAPLGTITLSPAGGSVGADTPTTAFVTTATTSKACPTGYGANASLRVRAAGAAAGNAFGPVKGAGGYDTSPVAFSGGDIRFSLARALSGNVTPVPAPAAGDYEIYAECFSQEAGKHADVFSVTITVTGTAWQVKQVVTPTTPPTTAPTTAPPTTAPTSSPPASASPSSSPSSSSASPSRSVSTSPTKKPGGSLPTTGAPVVAIALSGFALLFAGAWLLRVRRRRNAD